MVMQDVLNLLKVLADDTRLKIIMMLSRRDMCVCEIIDELAMSQPAVSHHLRILRNSGIVNDDKDGRWVFYSLNEKVFKQRLAVINNDLFAQLEENLKSRRPHRNYDICLRMEREMCSFLEVHKE